VNSAFVVVVVVDEALVASGGIIVVVNVVVGEFHSVFSSPAVTGRIGDGSGGSIATIDAPQTLEHFSRTSIAIALAERRHFEIAVVRWEKRFRGLSLRLFLDVRIRWRRRMVMMILRIDRRPSQYVIEMGHVDHILVDASAAGNAGASSAAPSTPTAAIPTGARSKGGKTVLPLMMISFPLVFIFIFVVALVVLVVPVGAAATVTIETVIRTAKQIITFHGTAIPSSYAGIQIITIPR